MRHTRSAMLQVLSADYMRTARAKGLGERAVVLKHALRNALMPIITLGALEFGTLLSGAVLTEQVFTIPGFGKLIVDAVFNRDYAVVQGVVLVTATAYIVLNLLADLAYFARQSEAAATDGRGALGSTPSAVPVPCRRRRRLPAGPWRRAWRRLRRRRARACSAWRRARLRRAGAVRAAGSRRTTRSRPAGARSARRRGAQHWFGTDEIGRDVLSRVIWGTRASLLAGVVSVSISLLLGVPIGLAAGFLGGWVDARDLAHHRRLPRLPVPDPGDRAGGLPRPEPDQRDDRDRHLGDADLRAADARRRCINVKVEDYIEAARAVGNPPLRHRAAPRAAEHRRAADRAGDAGDRRRGDRRGQPVVPRPRPAAAGAELGQHAQHRARTTSTTRPGWRSGRGCRSSCWCWRSTCSATACATRSIRASAEPRPRRSAANPLANPYSFCSGCSPAGIL